MPHLQIDTTAGPDADGKRGFAAAVTEAYVEEMGTDADHVAVTIRPRGAGEMALRRAVEGPILVLDADVRRGRPLERKRAFAVAVVELARDEWAVPDPNVKVTFTEHAGEEMMGAERVGGEWSPDGE